MTRRPMESAQHLQAFSSLLAQDAEAKALSTRDLQIIALLVSEAEAMTVGAISEKLKVTSPQISRITDKLAERGYVRRKFGKKDRRLVLYTPTPVGRALDERVRAHFEAAAQAAREVEPAT